MLKFAVIGHPINHSLSPKMHAANFKALSIDAEYEKFDVLPEDLISFVRAKRDEGYRGLNVTIPHKIAVIDALDNIDKSVEEYGSCNTIRFEEDGKISGFNTDITGYIDVLKRQNFDLSGKRVVILGCGGAGGALAAASLRSGAAEVLVGARRRESEDRLLERLAKIPSSCHIGRFCASDLETARAADLVVNATPLGLKEDDPSPLPQEAFRPGQLVLDIIPLQRLPPMAKSAKTAGAIALDGLDFLVAQGAESFKIWMNQEANREVMRATFFNTPLDFRPNIR